MRRFDSLLLVACDLTQIFPTCTNRLFCRVHFNNVYIIQYCFINLTSLFDFVYFYTYQIRPLFLVLTLIKFTSVWFS